MSQLRYFFAMGLLISAPLFTGTAVAQRGMPVQGQWSCNIEVTAPQPIRAQFQDYYRCANEKFSEWMDNYPEREEQLRALHEAAERGKSLDLRGKPEAFEFAQQHPIDPDVPTVQLSASQVESLRPVTDGEVAAVEGPFQKVFVDRANNLMYLSSASRGLYSLDISERYDFDVRGLVESSGADDFFIVRNNIAYMEDKQDGEDGDLVVLNVANPDNPRELRRLEGVLPDLQLKNVPQDGSEGSTPNYATYENYMNGTSKLDTCMTDENRALLYGSIQCDQNDRCMTRMMMDGPYGEDCIQQQPIWPMWQQRMPMMEPDVVMSMDMAESTARRGFSGNSSGPSVAMAQPVPPMTPPQPMNGSLANEAPSMPEGGAGGAGSLTQMMVIGNALYVLTTQGGNPNGYLTVFNITNLESPSLATLLKLNNGPEALSKSDDLLLVAGRDGIITASGHTPTRPRLLGEYRQMCPVNFDPIIMRGSIAYRTIQASGTCNSMLEVIDMSMPHQPVLRSQITLSQPKGLATLGNLLFIADEAVGVRVFGLDDPANPADRGTLSMTRPKDLVISGFDMYTLSDSEVRATFLGEFYQRGQTLTSSRVSSTENHLVVRSGVVHEDGTQGGLTGLYYNNMNLNGVPRQRIDSRIVFNWRASAPIAGVNADLFSVRWTGFVKAPVGGTLEFFVTGDDGVRLWVDNEQIVNVWRDQSSTTHSGRIAMTRDRWVPIRLELYERYGVSSVRLEWSGDGLSRQVVPGSALRPN